MFKIKSLIIGMYLAFGVLAIGHVCSSPEPADPVEITACDIEFEEEVKEKDVAAVVEEHEMDAVVEVSEPVAVAELAEVMPIPDEPALTDEEIELIALITMAEAEGESEEGKRLVIDTILNRVDHEKFPDTVTEVVYQKNQFTCVWNGRVDRCYVQDEIVELVKEELANRTNYDVIFFSAGRYSKYGVQLFAEGNHYFSRYA